MLTITYENRTGNALHTALEGLKERWLIINGTDHVEVERVTHDALHGKRLDAAMGQPTGEVYRIDINDIDTISV